MIKRGHMQQKYFLRQLIHHLIIITLPLLLLGIILTNHFQKQLQEELTVYAERSKNFLLSNVTEELNTFSEQTALFSTTPTLALSISRLLNEQSLDYKNNVFKSIIPTIIGTTANISEFVDSIYIYYDNPDGNFFSSLMGYTNTASPSCMDSQWLSVYQNTPVECRQWVLPRNVRYYSFEAERENVSVFRRFDYYSGVMVLNLNTEKLSQMLDSNHIYQGSCTLVTDPDGNIIFGSSGHKDLFESGNTAFSHSMSENAVYDTTQIHDVGYVYYSSEIPDYDLVMISLLPTAEVFKTVHNMVLAFTLIILFSILLSISLSFTGTVNNFRQLRLLLDLFSHAETGTELPVLPRSNARNEYDLIFNNIVSTFVSNHRLQLNLAQTQVRQKDAQLAVLQLQLNPHFIFNTLQTLDLEILKALPANSHAGLLVHNLSDILKYSLENTSRQVRIREEIAICKSYAEIQKIRYANPFILYWEYGEDTLDLPVIHLILQPLLENSLHHAIKELPRNGLIKIKIFRRENRIHFYVVDNGLGICRSRLEEIKRSLREQDQNHTSHIGLYNTNLRLVLTYGPEAAVRLQSKEGMGTAVHFSFQPCPPHGYTADRQDLYS